MSVERTLLQIHSSYQQHLMILFYKQFYGLNNRVSDIKQVEEPFVQVLFGPDCLIYNYCIGKVTENNIQVFCGFVKQEHT